MSKLDIIYEAKTAQGEHHGLYLAVGYWDGPTFLFKGADGAEQQWSAALSTEATPEQTVKYWKDRAMRAEQRVNSGQLGYMAGMQNAMAPSGLDWLGKR